MCLEIQHHLGDVRIYDLPEVLYENTSTIIAVIRYHEI